jgi:hypothetical protein
MRGGAPPLVSTLYHRIPSLPIISSLILPSELNSPGPFPIPHFFPTPDMGDQSASSHLQVLFEAALQNYEEQTGVVLAKHPLADRIQNCDSVESVSAVLHEQIQAFNEFREKHKVLNPLKKVVSVLCKLSATGVGISAWYVHSH